MLLALATLFVAAIARPFATPGPLLDKLRSLSWIGLAVLGSLGMVLAVNYIAFKEVGLAPKRYPFVLARAMELPSARHYLETACRTPRYELCRQFPHGLPEYAQEFLWGSEGISEKATPQQIDRLRAEEPILIWQVLRAAPVAVTGEIVEGVLVQLTRFGISDIAFDRTVHMTSPTEMAFVPAANDGLLLRTICRYLIIGSVVSSLIALLLWLRRTNDMWFFAVLLCGGVIANAAICATLSTIAERYQARVIWLLPLAAFALWAERKGDRAPPK
jgi:hypothetical protein